MFDTDEGKKLLARLAHGTGPGDSWCDEYTDWCRDNGRSMIEEIERLQCLEKKLSSLFGEDNEFGLRVLRERNALKEENERLKARQFDVTLEIAEERDDLRKQLAALSARTKHDARRDQVGFCAVKGCEFCPSKDLHD